METIGQRIAKQRLTKRWTQETLASELGITQSVLSDIENDKVSPKWDTIMTIAEKLDVSIASLLPNSESIILYQPNTTDNSVGFINHYNSISEERKMWEVLLKAKDDLIHNQKILIETLQAQTRK
jgi:transcriptional regulator with XRE-family HTH domain